MIYLKYSATVGLRNNELPARQTYKETDRQTTAATEQSRAGCRPNIDQRHRRETIATTDRAAVNIHDRCVKFNAEYSYVLQAGCVGLRVHGRQ